MGYPWTWDGVPPPDLRWGTPQTDQHSEHLLRGDMPLAFTPEDFLVENMSSNFSWSRMLKEFYSILSHDGITWMILYNRLVSAVTSSDDFKCKITSNPQNMNKVKWSYNLILHNMSGWILHTFKGKDISLEFLNMFPILKFRHQTLGRLSIFGIANHGRQFICKVSDRLLMSIFYILRHLKCTLFFAQDPRRSISESSEPKEWERRE